jgi:type II secretory ATPase GspE/PulE/Tfp pilus assembly ATPase PilB-like protein
MHTGYRGRIGLYETLPLTPTLMEAMIARVPRSDLISIATQTGYRPLIADGLRRLRAGDTTMSEIIRAVTVDYA